jgi:hypothetical protein
MNDENNGSCQMIIENNRKMHVKLIWDEYLRALSRANVSQRLFLRYVLHLWQSDRGLDKHSMGKTWTL